MDDDYLKDPEFQELIHSYLDYLTDSIPTIKDNLAEQDFTKIRIFGHGLKGSGGGYGFHDLSEIGRLIEMAANEQNGAELEANIQTLEKLVQEKRADFGNKD